MKILNKEIYRMPKIINKDTYFKLDTYEVINEKDIESSIENDVKYYFKLEEDKYRNNLEDKLTKNLKNDFITDKLNEYVDNSYLIKIKLGKDVEDTSNDDAYSSLNRIIKEVKKNRPNDYSEVIDKIVDIIKTKNLNKYSDEAEVEDLEVDDELVEAIKSEEKKPDKLTKYINETVGSLYSTCYRVFKEDYAEHYRQFLKENRDFIDTKTKEFIKQLKTKEKESYIMNRKRNIINLFNYIIEYYTDRLTWIEDNKYVVMITKADIKDNKLNIVSGSICPDRVSIDLSDCIKLERHDTSFTVIMKENSLCTY